MNKVGLGIIGMGVIGRKHLEFAVQTPYIRITGITDLREQSAREAAAEFGVEKIHESAAAMIADPGVDAVLLALPAVARLELALQAMAAGKHVLIEKPVGMTVAEVERLIEAKGKSRQGLLVGSCTSRFQFYESADVIREFVASGALGDLRVLRIRGIRPAKEAPASPPPAWRQSKAMNGGGILVNWGCYDLDYAFGLTGWKLKPLRVLAQTWPVAPHLAARVAPGSDAESHITALISCKGGVVILLERGEFTASSEEQICEIIGTHGSLKFTMMPGEGKKVIYTSTDPLKGASDTLLWSGDEPLDLLFSGTGRDFAKAILEGREPATTLERALVIQQISDAIYASADQGKSIELA